MTGSHLISDVTSIKVFELAVKLQAISADLRDRYFRDYILTEDLAGLFVRILASILGVGWSSTSTSLPAERRRAHLLSAQYGAGKSYFLTMLSAMLRAAGNEARLQTARDKFRSFRDVNDLLNTLGDKRFLIVQISAEDRGDIRLKELLVRGLLNEVTKVLPDAVFANEYTQAVSNVAAMESLPIGPTFRQALQSQFGLSLQQLLARLGQYDRDSLRNYYQTLEHVSGRAVSRDVLDVETTYREAVDKLRAEGYTHIAVLIDEMTAYLNASAAYHSLSETLGELQSFAAFCNSPVSHCLFVGAMHRSVREFLQDWSQQRDYEKVMGRFTEHDFPIYSNRLLAGVFQPNEEAFHRATRPFGGHVSQLMRLTKELRILDDGHPMSVSAFFPLHPAVVHFLPRIARELGQAERTSFGFINDVVRPKLGETLGAAGQLNLVTLDQVFDYFLPAIEQRPHYQQIISAYNAVRARVASPLAHRAFKPLAMLWVASRVREAGPGVPQTDLGAEDVADYIGSPDVAAVREFLEALRPTGYVYLDTSTQRYFYSHADAGWDLESEIQKQMAQVDADDVLRSELTGLGARVCLQVAKKLLVKVQRSLESQWINLRQLQETTSLKPRRAEGKIVFLVPELADLERYPAMWNDAAQKARHLSAANVVVAVPKQVDMLNPAELKRYRALHDISGKLSSFDEMGGAEHRVRVAQARYSEVRQRLRRDLEAFGQASNFIFFVNGLPCEAQDEDTILEDMFEGYYYKFPKVRVESINGRSTTNALIDTCILNRQTTFSGDTSEVARQARDTLQVLGLCTWEMVGGGKYRVELAEPRPGTEGFEIWQMVLGTLTDGSGNPFEKLYRRLGEPPYGLPYYMIELYIAAARSLNRVYIIDSNGKMPAVGRKTVADITKLKDKGFRVLPVERVDVPYTYLCSVWRAIDEPLKVRYYRELERNLGRTVDDQQVWFSLKADINNLRSNWLARPLESLEQIGARSAAFSALVEGLDKIRPIIIPAQGYRALAAVGENLSGSQVNADPDAAALAVSRTIEEVQRFLDDWPSLQAAWQLYRQVQAVDLGCVQDDAQSVVQAWQTYATDVLSVERRQVFLEQFGRLWEQYSEAYVREHNAVAKAQSTFGESLLTSAEFELLGAMASLDIPGVASQSAFAARIQETRRQACRRLSGEAMRDYGQFGRATCAACGYRIGTMHGILEHLQEQDRRLQSGALNALKGCLVKVDELLGSETLQVYTRERASADETKTLAELREVVRLGTRIDKGQGGRLRALVSRLGPIVEAAQAYMREQARERSELEESLREEERLRRIPRVPTPTLADGLRAFLLSRGLEAMTLDELRRSLDEWLQEVAAEFAPEAGSRG